MKSDFIRNRTTFLAGPAGAGKTTLAAQHLRTLLEAGTPGDSIVVMTPQRSLLQPYLAELRRADAPAGSQVETLTLGGLARRMVELFWPAVAGPCCFARPQDPPTFLTLETAQYYMQRVVGPLVAEAGYFERVYIPPNRLYSQILDNLNKAAMVGFSYLEIGPRLKAAWSGPASRAAIFTHVQDCAARFRQFCLQNNLLDFSLQVEILVQHLLPTDWFRRYLFGRYRHLIADNVEEEPPVTHDLLCDWLTECESALIIYDNDAGFRRFLGADPQSALRLRKACREYVELARSHVTSPDLQALAAALSDALDRQLGKRTVIPRRPVHNALGYGGGRFHPQMVEWVAQEIARLVNEQGILPGAIVVLAPYLSDALRFALTDRLTRVGIPTRSLRPSRALNEEPAARCLLTLAALVYPDWAIRPAQPDIAHALTMAIEKLDPTRAHLLAQRTYAPIPDAPAPALPLRPFDALTTELQDRIGYDIGERYETLRLWLQDRAAEPPLPLDHLLSRLFGEVLAQPGFAFHRDLDSGRIAAALIASARKFRQTVAAAPPGNPSGVGRAYFEMVQSGVIAAEYGRVQQQANAVLLAPAYTFLLSNQPVDVQFWLNAGSPGWWERLNQPLTHPYVLTRWWPADKQWTDEEEQTARVETLRRLLQGLIQRCRRRVYLAFSNLNEQGFEERGPLLMVVQQILRHLPPPDQQMTSNE